MHGKTGPQRCCRLSNILKGASAKLAASQASHFVPPSHAPAAHTAAALDCPIAAGHAAASLLSPPGSIAAVLTAAGDLHHTHPPSVPSSCVAPSPPGRARGGAPPRSSGIIYIYSGAPPRSSGGRTPWRLDGLARRPLRPIRGAGRPAARSAASARAGAPALGGQAEPRRDRRCGFVIRAG
jgi:hypothetical protein